VRKSPNRSQKNILDRNAREESEIAAWHLADQKKKKNNHDFEIPQVFQFYGTGPAHRPLRPAASPPLLPLVSASVETLRSRSVRRGGGARGDACICVPNFFPENFALVDHKSQPSATPHVYPELLTNAH
jgi:hypothetical protein